MSAQSTRDDEQQPLTAVESPGKRLRIARQAKGMSRGDVATHLHLSQSIVQALENDDHDRLPGPVFVRGYLRNYARMLGLNDDSILASYGNADTDHSHRLAPMRQAVKPEIRSSHFAVRLVSWILIVGLLGLLAVWWQGHLEWNNGGIDQTTEAEPDQAPDKLPRIGDASVEPAVTEEASEEPEAVVEEAARVATPEPPATTAPAVASEPQTVAAESASETPAEEPDAGGEPAMSKIVFEFLGPCWVDIRDSTRKFKLFGEMSKGKRKVLEGTPPYSVILGNSSMVQITVDGQPFDIESLSHGSVARFTLNPTATN